MSDQIRLDTQAADGTLTPSKISAAGTFAFPDLKVGGLPPGLSLAIDGGFEAWVNGTTFSSPADNTPITGSWTLDRNGSPTFVIQRDGTVVESGSYSAKTVITGDSGASHLFLYQNLTPGYALRGLQLQLTAKVRSNTANSIRIGITDDAGTSYSAYSDHEGQPGGNSAPSWSYLDYSAQYQGTGCQAFLLSNGKVLMPGGVDFLQSTNSDISSLYNPATYKWESTPSLPSGHAYYAGVTMQDGNVMLTGGQDNSGTPSSVVILYDPTANTWSTLASMNQARMNHTATVLPDGSVFVCGGMDDSFTPLDSAEIYSGGVWTTVGSAMSAPRQYQTATLLADNSAVLICGGYNNDGNLNTTDLFSVGGVNFSAGPVMNHMRAYFKAFLLNDNTILLSGGVQDGPDYADEIYDPNANSFTPTGTSVTGQSRQQHGGVKLADGTVLVAGGSGGAQNTSSEVFDPNTGTWTASSTLPFANYNQAMCVLDDGSVFSGGGDAGNNASTYDIAYLALIYKLWPGTWMRTGDLPFNDDGFSSNNYAITSDTRAVLLTDGTVLATCLSDDDSVGLAEIFDPSTNTWAPTTNSGTSRNVSPFGVALDDGRAVFGGGRAGGGNQTLAFDIYDNGSWSSGTMNYYHVGGFAVKLQDGRLLAGGGSDNGDPAIPDCELFDPNTNLWTPTANPMSIGRRYCGAVVLQDGRVLVIGGYDETATLVNSCEIYDPNTDTWAAAASMSEARAYFDRHAPVLFSDGMVGVLGNRVNFNGHCEVYDPTGDAWTSVTDVPAEYQSSTQVVLQDGRVMLLGGNVSAIPKSSSFLYDHSNDTWVESFGVLRARWDAIAITLNNGIILTAGSQGYSDNTLTTFSWQGNASYIKNSELFTVAAGGSDVPGSIWHTLTAIRTIDAAATVVSIGIGMMADGDQKIGTYSYDSMMMKIISPIVPVGSDKQLQYNDNGILGSSPNLTWDQGTLTLSADNLVANAVFCGQYRVATGEISIETNSGNSDIILSADGTGQIVLDSPTRLPETTNAGRDAITNLNGGLFIYNSETGKLNFYNDVMSQWEEVTSTVVV